MHHGFTKLLMSEYFIDLTEARDCVDLALVVCNEKAQLILLCYAQVRLGG